VTRWSQDLLRSPAPSVSTRSRSRSRGGCVPIARREVIAVTRSSRRAAGGPRGATGVHHRLDGEACPVRSSSPVPAVRRQHLRILVEARPDAVTQQYPGPP